MNSKDLSRDQLQQLLSRAEADQAHYAQLYLRLDALGCSKTDPLYDRIKDAHAGLTRLRMWLHYEVIERERRVPPGQ